MNLNPEWLISTFGLIGILAVVFAESGLLIAVAAIAGDQFGYASGRRLGPALFRRPNSRVFKQQNLVQAQQFFDKYGARSIVLARFVPIVRTFAPIVAGASRMNYPTFTMFNAAGGLLWATGITVLGKTPTSSRQGRSVIARPAVEWGPRIPAGG